MGWEHAHQFTMNRISNNQCSSLSGLFIVEKGQIWQCTNYRMTLNQPVAILQSQLVALFHLKTSQREVSMMMNIAVICH